MMQEQINLGKFDPSPLFETIGSHFPIGLRRRTEQDQMNYLTYPGLKLYSSAISDAIHKTANYESIWESVENELSSLSGKPVVGTTYGQAPCYSAFMKIRQEQFGSLTRYFEIHVFVSVIGPYFTVVGKDWSGISVEDLVIRPTNFFLVSPVGNDSDLFMLALELLKRRFPLYRYVPHCFYSLEVPDFEVPYSDEEENVLFGGLFNQEFRGHGDIVGDSYFGADEWIRSDYESSQGQWSIFPPRGA
jgi:hypothetical protein